MGIKMQAVGSTDWRDDAACVSEVAKFDAATDASGTHDPAVRAAKDVCLTCPVMQTCRSWAIATKQPFGVWGGLHADELFKQRTGRNRARSVVRSAAAAAVAERRAGGTMTLPLEVSA